MEISKELREQLLDPANIEIAWERAGYGTYPSTFDVEKLIGELVRVVTRDV